MRRSSSPRRVACGDRAVGRLSISAALAAFLIAAAVTETTLAGPGGARVRRGDVEIRQQGNRWIIHASDGSIIEFTRFDIARGELVRFIQPHDLARVLNRVTGDHPTFIRGLLQANGQVYIVNPAGVYFSRDATVNVGGLYAAAGNITDRDFLRGVNRFRDLAGEVINEGRIVGDEVHLIGERVANHGSIEADLGIVTMLAGDDVLIRRHGERIIVKIDGKHLTGRDEPWSGSTHPDLDADPAVSNTGTIDARRGHVTLGAGDLYAFGIHNSGSIRAARGEINLVAADGVVENAGLVSASTDRGPAGTVTVQGPSVVNSGVISADSDDARAGSVEVTSRNHTYLLDGSRISAAGGSGSARGGEILIHSYDGFTVFSDDAHVDVSGGREGGRGGFAEISGEELIFNGTVDLRGGRGARDGTLLIDPRDITIADTGTNDDFLNDGVITFDEGGTNLDITISDEAIEGVMGHIILQASRDLFVTFPVLLVHDNNVTLQAKRHIQLNAPISGGVDFELFADDDGDGVGTLLINVPISGWSRNAVFSGALVVLDGGSIETGGKQNYYGPVEIGRDTILTGTTIVFNDILDSQAPTNHDLEIDGRGVFLSPVGENTPLGSLIVTGRADIAAGLIATTGVQEYRGPVDVGRTQRFRGSLVHFFSTLDGGRFVGGDAVIVEGDARFDGAVGAKHILDFLRVEGATEMNAGEIWTRGRQEYLGAVTMGSDNLLTSTQNRLIHFAGSLDGAYSLFVRTGGTTRFDGAVGGADPLAMLRTDSAGLTRIGGDMFANVLLFQDRVRLESSVALTGFDSVTFGKSVVGSGHDLLINSPLTNFNGRVFGFGHLETDADGVTNVNTSVIRGGSIALNDNVILLTDASMRAEDFINLGPVDGRFALALRAGGAVLLAGDVGGDRSLAALDIRAGEVITVDANLIRALGDIRLDGGRAIDGPAVATIAGTGGDLVIRSIDGDFVMGPRNRMSVLGNLRIGGDTVTIGDLSTLDDMIVNASRIEIRTRAGGALLTSDGSVIRDGGVDFVSGGRILFSVEPVVLGGGPDPVFATEVRGGLSDTLDDFTVARAGDVNLGRFFFGPRVLDLTVSQGGDDLAEGLPEDQVPDEGPGQVDDALLLDPIVRRNLAEIGVYVRDMSDSELVATTTRGMVFDDTADSLDALPSEHTTLVNRLRRRTILEALSEYTALFYGEGVSIEGPLDDMPNRRDEIRTVLADVFAGRAEAGMEDPEAQVFAESVRQILDKLRLSGLSPREVEHARLVILSSIMPENVNFAQMEEWIENGTLGG